MTEFSIGELSARLRKHGYSLAGGPMRGGSSSRQRWLFEKSYGYQGRETTSLRVEEGVVTWQARWPKRLDGHILSSGEKRAASVRFLGPRFADNADNAEKIEEAFQEMLANGGKSQLARARKAEHWLALQQSHVLSATDALLGLVPGSRMAPGNEIEMPQDSVIQVVCVLPDASVVMRLPPLSVADATKVIQALQNTGNDNVN